VLKWYFQDEGLTACRREGTFIEWFEKAVNDLIQKIKEGGGEEPEDDED